MDNALLLLKLENYLVAGIKPKFKLRFARTSITNDIVIAAARKLGYRVIIEDKCPKYILNGGAAGWWDGRAIHLVFLGISTSIHELAHAVDTTLNTITHRDQVELVACAVTWLVGLYVAETRTSTFYMSKRHYKPSRDPFLVKDYAIQYHKCNPGALKRLTPRICQIADIILDELEVKV